MGVGGEPSADISRKRGFLASLDQVRSPQVLILLTLCQEQATDPLKLSFFIRQMGQETDLCLPGLALPCSAGICQVPSCCRRPHSPGRG